MPDRLQPLPTVDRDALAELRFSADGLTATQTTFTMPELVQAVAGSIPSGAPADR